MSIRTPRGSRSTPRGRDSEDQANTDSERRLPPEDDQHIVSLLKKENDDPDDREKAVKIRWVLLGVISFLWFVCGSIFFVTEGYGPVETIYIMVQILTTVGYGDVLPETPVQKICTALLVLVSTLIVAQLISNLVDYFLDKQTEMLQQSLENQEQEIKEQMQKLADKPEGERMFSSASLKAKMEEKKKMKRNHILYQLWSQLAYFVFFIVLGTVFFALAEPCSCSYGRTKIDGCNKDNCYEEGNVKTWIDSFYMSVITLTTVGFGDLCAETFWGRAFASVWMLLGVGATINLIGGLTDVLQQLEDDSVSQKVTAKLFHKMDEDKDNKLNSIEFMKLQLVMNGIATEDQLESIMSQFTAIDESNDGFIDRQEFINFYMPELAEEGCKQDLAAEIPFPS